MTPIITALVIAFIGMIGVIVFAAFESDFGMGFSFLIVVVGVALLFGT